MPTILAFLAAHLPQQVIDHINQATSYAEVGNTWGNSLLTLLIFAFVTGAMVGGRAYLAAALMATELLCVLGVHTLACYALGQHSVDPSLDLLQGYEGYHVLEADFLFAITLFVGAASALLTGALGYSLGNWRRRKKP